jgi:dethiobiotin synthetase/adenosylmethionine--8-amino-7-oxononanoate aminotransferase
MFAEAVHEPAMALAETLLAGMGNPRLTRAFFSDNGSTAAEVAVKMALRASRKRYGWEARAKVGILGLQGSYHGDTIGAMDCSEPCVFNKEVEWYAGKGAWMAYPTVLCVDGHWILEMPAEMGLDSQPSSFSSLSAIFDVDGREARGEQRRYERAILATLKGYAERGVKFGAVMMEPVVLGAGGMQLV